MISCENNNEKLMKNTLHSVNFVRRNGLVL